MAELRAGVNCTKANETSPKKDSNGMASSLKKETSGSSAMPVEKKPSLVKKIWDKIGLNPGILILMLKGALPPVIATALYQVNSFAGIYSTLGYLVSIMSIISFAILPRAKFIQTMVLNIVGVCIGAAIALLTVYCSVQARIHTTPVSTTSRGGPSPGTTVAEYNSSASAVSAIWLFANIFMANAFRASRPSLQFPVIIYSIFANVAATYSPQFPTMAVGIAFVKRLLEAFLTGFAIATGVSLCVFPISSRDVIFKEAAEYIASLQAALKSQTAFLETLESSDMFRTASEGDDEGQSPAQLASQDLKAKLAALSAVHAKMAGDLTFAKREIAYSKLDAKDIDEIFKMYRMIMLPVIGMGSVADIFGRLAEKRGWSEKTENGSKSSFEMADQSQRDKEVTDWNAIIQSAHSSFTSMNECLNEGLNHILYTLELGKKPKSNNTTTQQTANGAVDVEAKGEAVEPGDKGFAAGFKERIDRYYQQRENVLKVWKQKKGLDVPAELEGHVPRPGESRLSRSDQQQLYLMLYLEFLHYSTGLAILDLINFADAKVESGRMKKRRLILPGKRRIIKWIKNACSEDETSSDHTPDHSEAGATSVYLGDSLQGKGKDPEHLPPTNAWERFGDGIRVISNFFASPAASFGFRVACATMSIGILAYLRATQTFFVEQRLVWAMIMVAIGMTTTAGSGVFGLMGRIAGTFIAMIMSFVIWYVAGGDGVPAGVIVLLFVVIFVELYFLLKMPRFTPVVLITMVTQVLILGYELEVKVLGVALATSSGQLYYPIYELAPYRLATVAAGCFVGFIWLYFPFPVTARSQLRKDLGASLYLLARFYSAVHTTVRTRLKGDVGDTSDKNSPARKLDKVRNKLFSNEMALLAGLRVHSSFIAFEFTLGGKFPKAQYDSIIKEIQSILYYMALIAYSSRSFNQPTPSDPSSSSSGTPSSPTAPSNPWLTSLARLTSTINLTSLQTTSLLSLLASSITSGTPLPPFLRAPPPYQLREKMEALDHDILSIDHVAEPGYAAFAVGQVASVLIHDDLEALVTGVRSLVGEVDFGWESVNTEEGGEKRKVE